MNRKIFRARDFRRKSQKKRFSSFFSFFQANPKKLHGFESSMINYNLKINFVRKLIIQDFRIIFHSQRKNFRLHFQETKKLEMEEWRTRC